MKKAFVIGSPISHSLSPLIFELISRYESGDLLYGRQEVKKEQLPAFLTQLRTDPNYLGVNVTIPLKETVISFLDEVEPSALALGAVNVIQKKGQKLCGFNTDVVGIEETLKEKNFITKGAICFLWGAGGSAKAVAWTLGKLGAARVVVYNPTSNRGVELAEKFNLVFPETEYRAIQSLEAVRDQVFSLVINSTPVGMKVPVDESFFDFMDGLSFSAEALAFDLIYTPENTLFLKKANVRGLASIGGLSMLISQAIATWEKWIGPVKKKKELNEFLRPYLSGVLRLREAGGSVFLTGFMGVGKSSVGRMLSELTGLNFSDSDLAVERDAKMTIAQIFKEKGEAEFRVLERKAVLKLLDGPPSVVALGGGALMNPETLADIQSRGTLVHLTAEPILLEARIAKQAWKRPLMADLSPTERLIKIQEMMKERGPIYRQAHYEVATDDSDQIQAALSILYQRGVAL